MQAHAPKLFSGSFVAACFSNLFLFVAMYILFPVLPLLMEDELLASRIAIGAVLGAYTAAALLVRPFSGLWVDRYPGKKLFLLLYGCFAACFFGYFFAHNSLLLGLLRFVHGFFFGALGTACSALAISIMPRERLGTGIGIFGMTTALAMALGPTIGMFVLEKFSYRASFASACLIIVSGFFIGMCIRAPEEVEAPPAATHFSWKNMVLPTGYNAFISMICAVFIYGLFLNYIPLYAREQEAGSFVGLIFALTSVGLMISRLVSGRHIDRGRIFTVVVVGKLVIMVAFLLFVYSTTVWQFLLSAFFIGLGYGMLTPAYQTLFNTLAPPNKRGIANSMFFMSFDSGVGLSVLIGGGVAEFVGLRGAFMVGLGLLFLSLLLFIWRTAPRYSRDRVV